MWSKLVRLFKRDKRPVTGVVANDVLGSLVYSKDDECWMTAEDSTHLPFRFFIAGNWAEEHMSISPDQRLIEHAESIARAPDQFLREVEAFIRTEVAARRHLKGWEHEVSQLKVSALNLAWAECPNDGMIEFAGTNEYRLWRCDYIGRKPAGMLSFDS